MNTLFGCGTKTTSVKEEETAGKKWKWLREEEVAKLKLSDYLKKKKTRETRKRIVSVIAAIVVFVTTYAMVLPAITLDVSRAGREPGIAFEQMQFKTTASAASVTAADSTEEEVQVEEPAAEEPAEEETVKEEPAESSEEETSAASDTQKEAPAEPEEAEEVEEIEEVPKDQSSAGEADAASSSESDSSEAQNADTQDKQEGADQAGVDQSGAGTMDTDDTAATAETAAEFQIPALDALDFDDILTGRTNFYYYHPANAEEAESLSSDTIDDWKKVGSDTVLAPEDFVRVYLSYEIPAGALNETNAEARYRLPACLELSDRQIKAINKYENGIAASKSGSERDRYLGAEAIEGSRTPDETAGDEYISATVKVENTGSGRQDLVFTFIPYTVEKNQIAYDEKGQVTSRGQKVKGFFTFDLPISQIDFEKTGKETVEKEDGTAEEIQYSEAEVVFAEENNDKNSDEISRTLTMAAPAGNEDPQTRGQKSLTSKGSDYTVTVSYTDDAQIPDNAELSVREIEKGTDEYASYLKQAESTVDETKSVNEARFFDITILADGEKVEPRAAVSVQINFTGIEQTDTDDTQLLHYKDDKEVEIMDEAEFSKSEEQAVDTVQFETDGFSVYGIVGIEKLPEGNTTQTYETEDYIITASYSEKAEIPENAEFIFSVISAETDFDRYAECHDALRTLFTSDSYATKELLDLGFWIDTKTENGISKTEIEPADKVLIAIQFKDESKYREGDTLSVVHLSDCEPEIVATSELSDEKTVKFDVESFSAFAIVGEGSSASIEYTAPVPNESNVHKEGNRDTFLSNLPYGTVLIDYDRMRMSAFTWSGLSGVSSQDSNVTCTVELAEGFTLGKGADNYGVMYDNLTLAPGESKEHGGTVATVHYTNAATLSDGTKADVVVTISNTTIKNTGLYYSKADSAFFYGNGLLPAAASTRYPRIWGELDFNIKVVRNEKTGDLTGKTFLYGMDDYDLECRNTIAEPRTVNNTANFVLAIDKHGNLIGRKLMRDRNDTVLGYGSVKFNEGDSKGTPTGGVPEKLARYFSIPITDADEKVPLYNAKAINGGAVATKRLYFTSDPDSEGFVPNVTETETAWPAYALYKTAVYGREDGIFKFYLLTLEPMVSESVTLISGMSSEIYVPNTSCLFIDGYNLYPTRNDKGTLNSGYFLVANAEEGLTYTARCSGNANSYLRSSNMYYRIYSRTYEGGTISTSDTDVWGNQTAYGVHQPEGATGDKLYKEALLAVPKNKTAVYTMTPDTFWHVWKVEISEISDGTEVNTSGEIDLKNVTWTGGSYTYRKNGTEYTFTKDANGVISYTFTGVSEDHYIKVWWKKDPPQQTVTIIKKWNDEGNARLSRPDDITVHLVRSDNGRVNPDSDETAKTELVTGTDQNITGSTQWVKNDTANQWEYTFAVATLPEGVSFKAYEDQVSDYTGDAVENQNANTATEIGLNEDANTHQYEVVITNTRKNGTLSFSKTDQYGFPVEGALFRLYNDADCTQPPAAVYTATSDSTGTVTFRDVPCGMFYMKETNIPTYGEGSKPYTDNRRQVYQVVIHENSEDSTITPGTVANHVFTPSGNPLSAIINTKPEGQVTITKIVDGDATAQAQRFVFVMEFPANMAEKTIKINGSDETLGTAVGGKVLYEFTLSHNGSITFSALPDDMSYKVEEYEKAEFRTTVSIDPQPSAGTFIIGEEGNDAYVSGKIDADQDYTINYTNTYTKKTKEIVITKTDENGNELTGAVFTLIKDSQQVDGSPTDQAVSSTTFNLEYGIYCLTETTAPNGYVILSNKIYFKVDDNGITLQTVSVGNDGKTTYSDANEGDYPLVSLSDDALTVYVKNTPGQELPNTGGPGTLLYTLSGIALMLGAALMYGFRMRRRERRLN